MGQHRIDVTEPISEYEAPEPDSYYAVSKVAGEALGRLYHDRHAMDVVCLRIGSFRERPSDRRSLWNWLSPDDCTRLFEAALRSPAPGFRIVWGVSATSTTPNATATRCRPLPTTSTPSSRFSWAGTSRPPTSMRAVELSAFAQCQEPQFQLPVTVATLP